MASLRGRSIGLAIALMLAALLVCTDVGSADRTQTTPVVVNVERGGFHWSDAAIGLLAGTGLSLAACGCLALARLRDAETNAERKGEGQ